MIYEWFLLTGPICGSPFTFQSQVGAAMKRHMKTIPAMQQRPLPDQGMVFRDFDCDSSDSGLESIL
jgi:hypothetical protein